MQDGTKNCDTAVCNKVNGLGITRSLALPVLTANLWCTLYKSEIAARGISSASLRAAFGLLA
jgi:hypothetical protein